MFIGKYPHIKAANIVVLRARRENSYSKILEYLVKSKLKTKTYVYDSIPHVVLIFILKVPDKELEDFCKHYKLDMLDTHNITEGDLELIAQRIVKVYNKVEKLFVNYSQTQ